jgi:hypothetical protein
MKLKRFETPQENCEILTIMPFDPRSLAASLRAKFCCTGIYKTQRNGFTLFYGKDDNAR